ncbi:sulfite reductase subunit C [Endozoicomonas sp. 4G]|uniref:sulfite reductase subunit C n=1 Tax=Endozoicomonas sp. 4G TaxID=2872754 RepID=UPI002078BBE7|nr:sulfite reductase subunit C [Endozoicomonas sp. 4G]
MPLDIDIVKARANNEYRFSKVRGEAMLSLRTIGGTIPAHLLDVARDVAMKYGNGVIRLTTRQKLAMPGIRYEDMDKVNKMIAPFIKEMTIDICGIDQDPEEGYKTIGGRNIVTCQGNRICQKGNVDTTGMARRLEKLIYPSEYHLKTTIAGCPQDCAKANLADIGIFGIAEMIYDRDRCIGCGKCAELCDHHAAQCLHMDQGKVRKEKTKCIGCGECALVCPTLAWRRNPKKFYMVKLGGRTSKVTPRIGKIFLNWVTEDVIAAVIQNIWKFSAEVLDGSPKYLHMGHLIDMAGYKKFKEWALKDVELNPEAKVADRIYWLENEYVANMHVKSPNAGGH